MPISHEQQKERWNEEHKNPNALKQMDSKKLSGGVKPFFEFLKKQEIRNLIGLEMGCGKGRNVISLANEEIINKMYGFDFSEIAIKEARKRAEESNVLEKVQFDVMDATEKWQYADNFFDFGLDCFASTDIEDSKRRLFAINEMYRALKLKGYFLTYVMSTDDEYHKEMVEKSPAEEDYSFYNLVNGKFEKSFSEDELDEMYRKFNLVESKRVEKYTEFFGKPYYCKHHWRIYKK